ncbi:MAG TPA: dockerin type I repeat-containing protein, partial [Verrucomicrobiae bacterium]|nr:dockerin type I repeat-containing protein [Verrucomicrobiae bacterium]
MGIMVFGMLATSGFSTYFVTNIFVARFGGKSVFSHINSSFSRVSVSFLIVALLLSVFSARGATHLLGDLNGDGLVDVRDLVILQNHLNGVALLSSDALPLADLNDDGYITQADVTVLANVILGVPVTIIPRSVTLDPATGSTQVGVSVRPKAIFPKPIDTSTLNANNFYASFAGQKLPATIVPS